MARHEVRGGAGTLTLNANITAVSTTCQANGVTSGFPTGAVNPFVVTIDSERILCSAVSGSSPATITFAQRGYDGTTADAHTANTDIIHGLAAIEIDDLMDHVYDTTRDDHEHYLTEDRHAAVAHTTDMFGTHVVDNNALATGAVDARVLADDTIGSNHIADDQVLSAAIADDQILTQHIADDQIVTALIADDQITTPLIADDAITPDQLATDSVTADAILAGAVGTAELADLGVATGDIANLAVTAAKIADDTITVAKLAFKMDSGAFVGAAGAGGAVSVTFTQAFSAVPRIFVQIADSVSQFANVDFSFSPPTTSGFRITVYDAASGTNIGTGATRLSWFAITDL